MPVKMVLATTIALLFSLLPVTVVLAQFPTFPTCEQKLAKSNDTLEQQRNTIVECHSQMTFRCESVRCLANVNGLQDCEGFNCGEREYVPEPNTMVGLMAGVLLMVAMRRR